MAGTQLHRDQGSGRIDDYICLDCHSSWQGRNQELLSSILDGDLEISFLKDEVEEEQRALAEMLLKKGRAEVILTAVDELEQAMRLNEDLRLKLSDAEEAVVEVGTEKQAYRADAK